MDFGMGHATPFAQILSEKLGVPFEKIRLVQGDSDRLVYGGGSGGLSSSAFSLTSSRATWGQAAQLIVTSCGRAGVVDEPAFRDGNLVWGRVVDDIPAFERELVALFAEHLRSPA